MTELYSTNLFKKYSPNEPYQPKQSKPLSDHKRNLVSKGLPIKFTNEDNSTFGNIFLNEKGDIIVMFECMNGFERKYTSYLIDACDEILKDCK